MYRYIYNRETYRSRQNNKVEYLPSASRVRGSSSWGGTSLRSWSSSACASETADSCAAVCEADASSRASASAAVPSSSPSAAAPSFSLSDGSTARASAALEAAASAGASALSAASAGAALSGSASSSSSAPSATSPYMLNMRIEDSNTVFYSCLARFMNTITLTMFIVMLFTGLTKRNTLFVLVWLRPKNT